MTDESARQRGAEGDPREHARALIDEKTRRVPDFPEKGIIFQDLSPVLADGDGLASVVDGLIYGLGDVDLVGGIDATRHLRAGAFATTQDERGTVRREQFTTDVTLLVGERDSCGLGGGRSCCDRTDEGAGEYRREGLLQ